MKGLKPFSSVSLIHVLASPVTGSLGFSSPRLLTSTFSAALSVSSLFNHPLAGFGTRGVRQGPFCNFTGNLNIVKPRRFNLSRVNQPIALMDHSTSLSFQGEVIDYL
ncbi:MAG: hypothetical protein ACFFDI_10535 [Promethearchaeota archaeon]